MARIRTIKPDFFTSLTIADLSLRARLTFIGLWTHVDDEGRCIADPRLIKAALWPLDDVSSEDVMSDLGELIESSLITQYVVGNRRYLVVNGWREHQKINRPTKSKFPAPDSPDSMPVDPADYAPTSTSSESPTAHAQLSESSSPAHWGKGKEQGTGNRERKDICSPAPPSSVSESPSLIPEPPRKPKPGSDEDPDWLKFWATYPKKTAKEGARKSWAKALRIADAADIIAGSERYRDDPNRSPQYTKDPTTWLNNGCWDDEPLPARSGANGHQPYQDPTDHSVYEGDL